MNNSLAFFIRCCVTLAADRCPRWRLPWGNPYRAREGWGMGLALLLLIWLITLVSTYFFVAKTWWLPVGASAATGFIDRQFTLTFIIMGVVFLAAQLGLGYIVWRYKESKSSPPVSYSHGNTTLEVVWTLLTAVLFIGLNLMGSSVWASQRFDAAEAGAVKVEVTGMQFAWYFRYPGPDGKYAATKPELMDPSAGGEAAVGLDTTDPAVGGRDSQFLCSLIAFQAGRGTRTEHPHAFHADGDRRI